MDMLNPISAGVSAASGLAGTIGSWLGIGQKRQVKQQKELQEHAAKTNYEYGEKSAENAFERQMKAYEQTYSDNTLQNQVNQAKDAGLSVGLLYGGGAQGGGEGSLSGGTQGTGAAGVGAGQAPQAGLEMQGLALMQQGMRNAAEIDLMKSQSDLNEAKAKETNASAGKLRAETESIDQIRQYMVEGKHQEAISTWLSNVKQRMELEGDSDSLKYENEALNMMVIAGEDSYSRQMFKYSIENSMQNVATQKALEDYYTEMGATQESVRDLNNAMEAWYDEKTKYVFQEVYNEYIQAIAALKNANTNEFNAEVDKQWKNAEIKIRTYLANNENGKLKALCERANMEYDGNFAGSLLRGGLMILGGLLGGALSGGVGAAAGASAAGLLIPGGVTKSPIDGGTFIYK